MITKIKKWFASTFPQPPELLNITHRQQRSLFKWVKQDGEWSTSGRTLKVHQNAFEGDCDDWAATMCGKLGKGSLYVEFVHHKHGRHAVCEYQGWISDNMYKHPYPKNKLAGNPVVRFAFTPLVAQANGYRIEKVES